MATTEMRYYGFTCVGCGGQCYTRSRGRVNRSVCVGCEQKQGEKKETQAELRERMRKPDKELVDEFKMSEDEKDGK